MATSCATHAARRGRRRVQSAVGGINAIPYYLNDIFAAAGFGRVSAAGQAVIIGATNLVFTVTALAVIDRFGRKSLLQVGSIGIIFSLAATAYIELSRAHQEWLLWMLMLFIASFAFSPREVGEPTLIQHYASSRIAS